MIGQANETMTSHYQPGLSSGEKTKGDSNEGL